MSYRKKMSKRGSKSNFKRHTQAKKINHAARAGMRGGIRL